MEDAKILDLYFARDEDAIRETDTAYGKRLHTLAKNILQNREDAEESVNDTYAEVWKSIPPRRPRYFFAFLASICRHLSLNRVDWKQAAKRRAQVVPLTEEMENCIPDVKGVEQVAEEALLVSVINRFLVAQEKTKRNIFILRYWFLYSIRDIADMYGERESKIKALLFRMRNELKKLLEKEDIYL